eukprot:scaffold112378_cov53-Phaeocystis_antarctica.AAC.2
MVAASSGLWSSSWPSCSSPSSLTAPASSPSPSLSGSRSRESPSAARPQKELARSGGAAAPVISGEERPLKGAFREGEGLRWRSPSSPSPTRRSSPSPSAARPQYELARSGGADDPMTGEERPGSSCCASPCCCALSRAWCASRRRSAASAISSSEAKLPIPAFTFAGFSRPDAGC